MTPLFAFLSPMEMGVVLIVAMLLFGNRLPSVMRSLGRGVTEFKKGVEGIEDDDSPSSRKSEAIKGEEAKKAEEKTPQA
jgi:sec-independent protein translocase protein TatA